MSQIGMIKWLVSALACLLQKQISHHVTAVEIVLQTVVDKEGLRCDSDRRETCSEQDQIQLDSQCGHDSQERVGGVYQDLYSLYLSALLECASNLDHAKLFSEL